MNKCPTCQSPSPKLHPAVQSEGEVSLCRDEWHEPHADEIESEWLGTSLYPVDAPA